MRVAIIPARGGSRRIPYKNIRPFHGKPIIAHSIATAIASGLFSRVYVSTEDTAIAAVAQEYHAAVLRRPHALALDQVGTQEVARRALLQVPESPDQLCVIYATAPLMQVDDLRRGLATLMAARQLSYVHSTGPDLKDAGQWYWGWSIDFIAGVPLDDERTLRYVLPAERVCDINTADDWARAERLYDECYNPKGVAHG